MNWTTSRPPAARIAVRAGAFVAVIASGALALTACSSGGSSSADAKASGSASASAAASGGGANGADMNAYRQCLSQHGVNLPTFKRPSGGARPSGAPSGRPSGRPSGGFGGGFGGGGGFPGFGGASPDAATQKALKACASKAPKFNGRGGQGANSGADASAIQAFTGCLKDHGVTLPTPTASASGAAGGRGAFGELRNLNTADPKTAKAYDTCKALLPQRPSSSPS